METKDVFGNLPTLETGRLVLRKVTLGDGRDFFEYASDPEVARYTTWEPHQSIEDSLSFLRLVLERYDNQRVATWGVEHKRDQKFIGTCGFLYWAVPDARAEVAYALSRKYWGQGLMTTDTNGLNRQHPVRAASVKTALVRCHISVT